MKILGLDPGKSTGWAIIEVVNKRIKPGPAGTELEGNVVEIGSLIPTVDLVVAEDFKLRPNKARAGVFDYSDMIAPKVIGKIELLCEMHGVKLVKQQASVKPVAYGFSGFVYVQGKKNQHWKDAYCHAVFYAVKQLGALPVKKA